MVAKFVVETRGKHSLVVNWCTNEMGLRWPSLKGSVMATTNISVRSSGLRVNVVHVGDVYQTPNMLMEGGCVKCHGAPSTSLWVVNEVVRCIE